MLRIAVLGAGVMATALTFPAVENGNEVRLIGTHLDDDIINSIQPPGSTRSLNSRLTSASRRTIR
ncbi:glycerol-3-phosphate dehydrogenase [Cutibacterium acnes JCM 18920]|nr:glycerol-3-phosphate dehydrogenase [Cutibacterium acnes JCM 18920]